MKCKEEFHTGSRQPKPQFDTVLVRFGGEIGIKAAWTRKLYERRLASNIRAMLKRKALSYEIMTRQFGRLYIRTARAEETCKALSQVFGISSVSSAIETTSQLKDIAEKSVLIAGSMLREKQTFAVRCRRVGSHEYHSQDVCSHVGQAILDVYANCGIHVDLKHPDVTLEVEVRENRAYVFTESYRGPGGLPLGVQPRIIGLLNSDVNSSVALWMVMKRGCPIMLLHFERTSGPKIKEKRTLEAAKTLFKWAPGFSRRAYFIPYEASLEKIDAFPSEELKRLLQKRLMIHVAEKLAQKRGAEGIVTGDVLNRPTKKSLHLLRLCDEASLHLPIYRPLIGLEDSEIEAIARRISVNRKLEAEVRGQDRLLASAGEITLTAVKAAESRVRMDDIVESSLESLGVVSL